MYAPVRGSPTHPDSPPVPHILAIYHSWNLIDDSVRYILCCWLSKASTLTAMGRAALLML